MFCYCKVRRLLVAGAGKVQPGPIAPIVGRVGVAVMLSWLSNITARCQTICVNFQAQPCQVFTVFVVKKVNRDFTPALAVIVYMIKLNKKLLPEGS